MWVERFGAGRNPLMVLQRMGYPVSQIPPEAGTQTDKITRAMGAVFLCEQHRLFLPYDAGFDVSGFEEELVSFPNAAHDDQVDCTSYAARLMPQFLKGDDDDGVRSRQGPVWGGDSGGMFSARF